MNFIKDIEGNLISTDKIKNIWRINSNLVVLELKSGEKHTVKSSTKLEEWLIFKEVVDSVYSKI